jgi:hypothetical protein
MVDAGHDGRGLTVIATKIDDLQASKLRRLINQLLQ